MSCAAGDGCVISKTMPGKVDIERLWQSVNYSHIMSEVVGALLLARSKCLSVSVSSVPSCSASYFELMVQVRCSKIR